MIIYREFGFSLILEKLNIYIDGVLIGKLSIMQTRKIDITTGDHDIYLELSGETVNERIHINESHDVRLKCRISPIIDLTYIVPLVYSIFVPAFKHILNYNFQFLLALFSFSFPIIIFCVLSKNNKSIRIKKIIYN